MLKLYAKKAGMASVQIDVSSAHLRLDLGSFIVQLELNLEFDRFDFPGQTICCKRKSKSINNNRGPDTEGPTNVPSSVCHISSVKTIANA